MKIICTRGEKARLKIILSKYICPFSEVNTHCEEIDSCYDCVEHHIEWETTDNDNAPKPPKEGEAW